MTDYNVSYPSRHLSEEEYEKLQELLLDLLSKGLPDHLKQGTDNEEEIDKVTAIQVQLLHSVTGILDNTIDLMQNMLQKGS